MSKETVCPNCGKVLLPFRWGNKHYIRAGTEDSIACLEGLKEEQQQDATKRSRKRL